METYNGTHVLNIALCLPSIRYHLLQYNYSCAESSGTQLPFCCATAFASDCDQLAISCFSTECGHVQLIISLNEMGDHVAVSVRFLSRLSCVSPPSPRAGHPSNVPLSGAVLPCA